MAIVDLGTLVFPVGGVAQLFTGFSYNQRRAYALYFNITPTQPTNIFSELEVRPLVTPNNGQPCYGYEFYRVEINKSPRCIFIPFSRLYDSNGTCQLEVERINLIRGGGDSGDVTVNVTYDDDLDIPSWIN